MLSHSYQQYNEVLSEHLSDSVAIIIVNWHQGFKAPNAIFTVQSTGDMKSGHYSPIDARLTLSLFSSVEVHRQAIALDSCETCMEKPLTGPE